MSNRKEEIASLLAGVILGILLIVVTEITG